MTRTTRTQTVSSVRNLPISPSICAVITASLSSLQVSSLNKAATTKTAPSGSVPPDPSLPPSLHLSALCSVSLSLYPSFSPCSIHPSVCAVLCASASRVS
eukprot:COSAG02_NODE_2216_length_9487_cov_916.793460_5_plen_100_part_00